MSEYFSCLDGSDEEDKSSIKRFYSNRNSVQSPQQQEYFLCSEICSIGLVLIQEPHEEEQESSSLQRIIGERNIVEENSSSSLPSLLDRMQERIDRDRAQRQKMYEEKRLTYKQLPQIKIKICFFGSQCIKARKRSRQDSTIKVYKIYLKENQELINQSKIDGSQKLIPVKDNQRRSRWFRRSAKTRNLETLNHFLNCLTDDEFTEFISNKDLKFDAEEMKSMQQGSLGQGFYNMDAIMDTGKLSEIARSKQRRRNLSKMRQILTLTISKRSHLNSKMNCIQKMHEIENEFKVFRDPTFSDFIKIFGKSYNPDLPLFAQLFILKEIMGFYHFYTNQMLIGYFWFKHSYMFQRKTVLASFPRVIVFYLLTQSFYELVVLRNIKMEEYRVNINELLDSEQFDHELYQNEHIRAIVKKIKNEFNHLVNPILSDFKNLNPAVDEKYKEPRLGYQYIQQAELIPLFAQTFNSGITRHNVYLKMIEKYDQFFAEAKENQLQELKDLMTNKNMGEILKTAVIFYDSLRLNKGNFEKSGNQEVISMVYKSKKAIYRLVIIQLCFGYQFYIQVDSFIGVLCKEFSNGTGEIEGVSIRSTRREKMEFIRKISNEMEPRYKDQQKIQKMIEQSMERFMNMSIDKKEQYVPKPKLKFIEYNAIKNTFSSADFERNSLVILGIPITQIALIFAQRVAKKMRWL